MLTHYQTGRDSISARLRLLPVHLLFGFLLVFVQSAALVHSHDGDLQTQFDCEICLKVNSSDHALASNACVLEISASVQQAQTFEADVQSRDLPTRCARAPPYLI